MGHLPDFIQIGYPKTGSRWLDAVYQQHPQIISNTKNIFYYNFDTHYRKGPEWYADHFREEAAYKPPTDRDRLELNLPESASPDTKKIVIENAVYLSQGYTVSAPKEAAAALLTPQTPYEAWEPHLHLNQTDTLVRRIQDTVPNTRILMVVRNQVDWHMSYYAATIQARVWHHGEDLRWDFGDYLASRMPGQVNLAAGRYHDTLKPYQEAFGPENVKVLVYEQLARDPEGYLKQLYNFLGIEYLSPHLPAKRVNRRLTNSSIRFILGLRKLTGGRVYLAYQWVPRWIRRAVLNLVEKISAGKNTPLIDDESRRFLEDYYRENNKMLADRLGMDLKSYGYLF